MSQPIFNSLTNALSTPRIGVYIAKTTPKTCLESTSLYFYNVLLCESLYPAIHILEITLRNNINEALKQSTGQSDWYDIPYLLINNQTSQVAQAKTKILQSNKPITSDQIVSELSMGFWVGLFNAAYEHPLWRKYNKLMSQTIPRASKHQRTRDNLSRRLNPIRELRNRVFHHESIWDQRDLDQVHTTIYEVLKWLNPDMAQLLSAVDRFTEIRQSKGSIVKSRLFQSGFTFEGITTL